MAGYVLKRIGYSLLTILVLVALTFFMMQLLPGDPFIGAKAIDESTKAMLMAKYGLDKPVWQQFIMYVGNVFQGDLGVSTQYKRPVVDIIAESFPYSFELGIRALIFAAVMGVLLGIVAAEARHCVGYGQHADSHGGRFCAQLYRRRVAAIFLQRKAVPVDGYAPVPCHRLDNGDEQTASGLRP